MLYHTDLGFPDSLELREGYYIEPKYSAHALKAAKEDRYGIINLPKTIEFSKKAIIEVETKDNVEADKIVVRIPYSGEDDLCLVILLDSKVVKTVWLNKRSDKHNTLDKNKYSYGVD